MKLLALITAFLLLTSVARAAEVTDSMLDYIRKIRPDDAQEIAQLLVDTANEANSEFDAKIEQSDVHLMTCVARYEARFKTGAASPSGRYNGMFQMSTGHIKSMRKLGLEYWHERDRLIYGYMLYNWHGLQPWGVRRLAKRDYKRYFATSK